MNIIYPISEDFFDGYVRAAFEGDKLLFDKFHVIKNNEELAIKDTIEKILDVSREDKDYVFVGIEEHGERKGYFSYWDWDEYVVIHSFGINVKYRSAANKKHLFNFMKEMSKDKPIHCYLRTSNARAIGWLKKCGMKEQSRITMEEDVLGKKMSSLISILIS